MGVLTNARTPARKCRRPGGFVTDPPGLGAFWRGDYAEIECPTEPACWGAACTRAAMADSASLPHARGS